LKSVSGFFFSIISERSVHLNPYKFQATHLHRFYLFSNMSDSRCFEKEGVFVLLLALA